MRVDGLTAANLQERQRVAEDKATTLMNSVASIYSSEGDPNYHKAEARLVGIITYHLSKELAIQSTINQDETGIRPTDHTQ